MKWAQIWGQKLNSIFLSSIRKKRDWLMAEASWGEALPFAMQVIDFRNETTCYDVLAIVTILRQMGDKLSLIHI
jgi:hypothetical protein